MEERQTRERMWRMTGVFCTWCAVKVFAPSIFLWCSISFNPLVSSSESPRSFSHILSLECILLSSLSLSFSYLCFPFAFGCIVSVSFRHMTCGLVSILTQMFLYCAKKQITFHAEKDARRRVFARRHVSGLRRGLYVAICIPAAGLYCAALQKTTASSIVAEF